MAEYHVGCGAFAIYAGTLTSWNKNMWQNKTECTDEAICAVRDYMISDLLVGFECTKGTESGYAWDLKDGRTVTLKISITGGQAPQGDDGEPYEEPTPTQDDRERLENLLGNSPMGTEATTEYLLSHGVTFREG